jgi:hypothetical protein
MNSPKAGAAARLVLACKAGRELGLRQTALYAAYQLGKKTGWYARRVRPPKTDGNWRLVEPPDNFTFGRTCPPEADEVLRGRVTLWGSIPLPLDFAARAPLQNWTHYETGQVDGQDIKFTWEPARFGWAVTLARAYAATGDPRYPQFFQQKLDEFTAHHPPYRGPHWANGQEVALRLIHLVCAAWLFHPASLEGGLGGAVARHAARIAPTLIYARAQNNNHLISEAAGLYTAGVALPAHPHAPRWRKTGWRWLHHALQTQIGTDGAYVQQSTNYHRLMLQLALWANLIAGLDGRAFPPASLARLAAAARWLSALCEPETGRVPNLGANDGASILPLADAPFHDYRPVLQAASRAFPGATAESQKPGTNEPTPAPTPITNYSLLLTPYSSLLLRAARFTSRPGHADQLHADIWWRGVNLARDPGTFQYNADPPWDNALQSAFHHNTVTLDGRDQMTRAGRFLYVDRAQATVLERTPERITAEHDGYRALGLVHRRTAERAPAGWLISDLIYPTGRYATRSTQHTPNTHHATLHWLFPDWQWALADNTLRLQSPHGWVEIAIGGQPAALRLVRAAKYLHGAGAPAPTLGWYSPTYCVREPALSLLAHFSAVPPFTFTTAFHFPASQPPNRPAI